MSQQFDPVVFARSNEAARAGVHRHWILPSLAAAMVLVLAGCGSSGSHASGADTASPVTTIPPAGTPVSGGSLSYAVDEAEDSLDPAVSPADVTALIDRNIFDSLVVQTGANSFGPWLATSWTVSPDGKTYTFDLKQGVTFQDGTPFNAAAVVASLNHVVAPSTKSEYASALIAPYESSTAINTYTVQVNLKTPFSPFLQALSTAYLGIQSPTELAKPSSQYIPVGTGPYKYVAWNQNQNVILQATPTYSSPPSNASHSGPAYIQKLTFDFISEDATRYGALTSGQVQGIADVPPIDVTSLEKTSGYYIQTDPSPGNNYNLYLNVKNGAFTNLDVRKAFVESIDVPALIDSIYFGQYKPATNPLGPTTAFFDAAAQTPPYDPANAEKLLAEAGYTKVDSAGYRVNSAGQELTLVWPYDADYNREERNVVGDGIVAEAKKVGIKIERPTINETQLITDIESGSYALFDSSFVRGSADILRYSYVEPFTQGGGDLSLINDPQLDAWLNGAAETSDSATQQQDYYQAQQYVLQNAVVLPLYVEEYRMGASDKLHGITFDAQAFPLFYGAWLSS